MKQKLPTRSVKLEKTVRLVPFENRLHLSRVVSFDYKERRVGALLLQRSASDYSLVFVSRLHSVHTTLRDEQMFPVFEAIEAGLKDLVRGESTTLHLRSFGAATDRQTQLDDLIERSASPELRLLLLSEKARVQALADSGIRKPKELYVLFSCEFKTDSEAEDLSERALELLAKGIYFLAGRAQQARREALARLMHRGFENFLRHERLFSKKMGLPIDPLDENEIWRYLQLRLGCNVRAEPPQLLVVDRTGLTDVRRSDLHAVTHVLAGGAPAAHHDRVVVGGKQIGVLTFVDKPGGWADQWQQLRYLWEVMARQEVADTEIFAQISAANPKLVSATVQTLLKQSNTAAEVAERGKSIDAVARIKVKRAVQAQEKIYEGDVPVWLAVAFLVHRDTREELDGACRQFESYFRRPAWVQREVDYAWEIWLQTLPIVSERLLAKPFDRRQLYLSGEAPGLLPLVCTSAGDSSGFELIAEEGGTPVRLDLFRPQAHKNLGIFATTRAGKSVLVSGILTQALAYGLPVVALDFPKPDGTSTFTDYTRFVGGATFDIARESNNLFEVPDLRHLSPTEQQERFVDYQSFLESALLTMVVGQTEDSMLTQTVRSLLTLALNAFFNDRLIRDRYEAAIAGGFGSPQWQKMPTMADYLPFCSQEHLDLASIEGDTSKGLERIALRLRFWLTSRVGRAISMPSSFPSDAQLLIFALRNLSSEEDAAVLALSAYSAALRRALSSPASIFFIDEAPILFEFETIANLVGRLCANGAKAGVRVILSGQDPDTIARSQAASKIFQNLTTRLVGRIQPTAIDSFERILKYPRRIISRNATESFFPRREGLYSQWLLDDCGRFTTCRYYPSEVQLAAVANNPDEQAARERICGSYPSERRFEAMAAFARHYAYCIRNGLPLDYDLKDDMKDDMKEKCDDELPNALPRTAVP